jgi:TP901 family phage tail tape measure protein
MPSVTFNFDIKGAEGIPREYKIIEKAAETSAAAQVKAAQKVAKETAKAEAQKQREAQKTAKEAVKAEDQKSKAAAKTTKDALKAEEQKTKAAEKGATQRVKAEDKAFKDIERQYKREVREAQNAANARVTAEERAAKAIAKERARSLSNVGGVSRSGAAYAAMGAAGLAAGVVGAGIREGEELKHKANRISIAGRRGGQEATSPMEIVAALHETAASNPGVTSDELSGGVQEMVKLGATVPEAIAHLKTMATTMQSMGTGAEDTAKIMMALKQSFGINGVKEMQQSMATLEAQAKNAGVPLEDLGAHILTMASAGKRFGMTGTSGAAQMGGLLAIARTGIGDPEKAEKGATKFLDTLTKQAPKLAAMAGVHVFDKQGKINPINDVVKDLITHVGGPNMSLKKVELGKLLGVGERGGAGVIGHALGTYTDTFQATTGTKDQKTAAATAALQKELADITGSTATYGDMQKNAAQIQAEAGAQMTAAWDKIVGVITVDAAPAVERIVPKLAALAPAIEPVMVVFSALAESGADVLELFKFLGMIHPHEDTPQEKIKKAQKELDAFDASQKGVYGPMGPEDEKKRAGLEKSLKDANEEFMPTGDKGVLSNLNKMVGGRDPLADFGDKYAKAQGYAAGSVGWDAAHEHAKDLEADIRKGDTSDLSNGRDSKESKDLIQNAQAEVGQEKGKAAFEAHAASVKASQDALSNLNKTIATATAGLAKLGDAASRVKPLSDHT